MGLTGQSIAAASDSVSRNGKKNTTLGWLFVVGGCLIAVGCYFGIKFHFNKKDTKAKHRNVMEYEKVKHVHKIEEMKVKQELQKDLIDHRRNNIKSRSDFDPDPKVKTSDIDASVATYDEIVSEEGTVVDDLRMGLRCFHVGEDCGLLGRTQVGKTTFLIQYSIAVARGYQEDVAKLTTDWNLSQPMKVLYFAFEQNPNYFKTKYGNYVKNVPNLHIEFNTDPGDFDTIRNKIITIQSQTGESRLLVIFDNITKMKVSGKSDTNKFFRWLDSYRKICYKDGKPITYIKTFHTQGEYKDHMPFDATNNYGTKTDVYFTQDLVAFGMCKGGDGRMRYLKEIKNKLEPNGEKRILSVYRFADTGAPMFDYVGEEEECDVLPSKADLMRGKDSETKSHVPGKRGRPERYSEDELKEIYEEYKVGFSWKEVMENHKMEFNKNKKKGLQDALKRHGYIL